MPRREGSGKILHTMLCRCQKLCAQEFCMTKKNNLNRGVCFRTHWCAIVRISEQKLYTCTVYMLQIQEMLCEARGSPLKSLSKAQ